MKKIALCAAGLMLMAALCQAQPIPEGNTYPGPFPAGWGLTLTEMTTAQLSLWLANWESNIIGNCTGPDGYSYRMFGSSTSGIGENLDWLLTPPAEGLYYGYMATGDATYVSLFVGCVDQFIARAVTEPDGYPGWPQVDASGTDGDGGVGDVLAGYNADSMLGEAAVFRPIALMAWQMINNPALNVQYAAKGQSYLTMAERIYAKWAARGGWQATTVNGVNGEITVVMPQGLNATNTAWVAYSTNPTGGMSHPCNKANEVARWMLAMYDVTGDAQYKTHATNWFTLMKSRMSPATDSWATIDTYGNCIWNYWEPAGPWDYTDGTPNLWIGTHPRNGYYEIDTTAIVEAYEHGVVFSKTDIASLVHIAKTDWTTDDDNYEFDPSALQVGMSISVYPASGTATEINACFANSLTSQAISAGAGALNGTIVSTTYNETTGTGTTVVQPTGGGSNVTITMTANTSGTGTSMLMLREWMWSGTAPYDPDIETSYVASENASTIANGWGELSTIPWWLMLQAELTLEYGSVEVTLGPAAAVTAGAQWNLDGGAWQNSGVTLNYVSVGSHTVNFNNVAGWSGPASVPITVVENVTTSLLGETFTWQTGGLTITLGPAAAVSAGAAWQVDSDGWQSSGATVTGLSVGDHTVTYQTVAGWTAPASEPVAISNAVTFSMTRTYVQQAQQYGSVQVTLGPQGAVTAGAEWNVDGGAWQIGGATVSGQTVGTNAHTINYKTIANWNTPASVLVTITANTTTQVTGTYTAYAGSVQVTLAPAGAITAGAEWNVDGLAWQQSGAVVSNLLVAGSHTVNYKSVTGWTSPSSAPVTITDNGTTAVTGTYVEQYGSLTVTLGPAAAVTAGAEWSVDGGSTWQISGATIGSLGAGSQTIVFKPVASWALPASQTVSISTNVTTVATGTYVSDTTPPAVSCEYPAPGDAYVDPLASIKLRVDDAGSAVNLGTVRITASRDGGATSETICDGSNLAPAAPAYAAPYLGYFDATAAGNTVFKGRTYIGGAGPSYEFLFEPDTDAAFGYDETVTVSVTAADWAGNTMTPSSATTPPSLYDFTITPREFGCNLPVDGGTAGDAFAAMATDATGNIWIAWERDTDATLTQGTVWLAERKDAANAWSFGAEIPVTSFAQDGDCHKPALAITASGTIYAAYEVHNGATPAVGVLSATTAAPTVWTATSAGLVIGATFTLQTAPAITFVNSAGTLYVAGIGADSGGVQQIGIASLAGGATSWTVTQVTSGGGNKSSPAIAQDVNGIVYVVWTNTADSNIYGADSSTSWATIHQVTNTGTAGAPGIATESSGNVLHFVWAVIAATPDIQYADTASTGGWPTTALTAGTSVMAGSGILNANFPRIAVTGTTGGSANAQVFIVWQGRLSNVAGDTDIYFTEKMWNGQFYPTPVQVSAVPAGLGLSVASAQNPALGVRPDNMPYAAWTDLREAGASHIFFAEAMGAPCLAPPAPSVVSTAGTPSGTPLQFLFGSNPCFTEVDLTVPGDAFGTSINLMVNALSNPVVQCPGGSNVLTAAGSGLYLDITGGSGCGGTDSDGDALGDWITVTIHLAPGYTLPSPVAVYRLVAPTVASLGAYCWTTDLIQNVSCNSATNVLTFQTMHLSSFGVGAGAGASGGAAAAGGGGGGGGGCAMTPNGEPDLFLLLLPLAGLGIWAGTRLAGRKRPARS